MDSQSKNIRHELATYIPELPQRDPWNDIVFAQEQNGILNKYISHWLTVLRTKCRETFPNAYAAMEAQQFRGFAVTRLVELTLTGLAMYGAVILLGSLFRANQPPRPYSCGGRRPYAFCPASNLDPGSHRGYAFAQHFGLYNANRYRSGGRDPSSHHALAVTRASYRYFS